MGGIIAQPVSRRLYPGPFWRLWSLWPGESVLRAPYLGTLWPAVSMAAMCECPEAVNPLPRHHGSIDPACQRGISAFGNRNDAELDGSKLTAINQANRRARGDELPEIIVLGVVELYGNLLVSHNPVGGRNIATLTVNGASEFRGTEGGTMKRLVVVEDWCDGKDADPIVRTLAATYRGVRVESFPSQPGWADAFARLRAAFAPPDRLSAK